MAEVTIGIPTYFANKMTTNCVGSILAVCKNPKIMLLKNDIGWLKACNKIMLESKDDIILLNDDTYLVTDIIEALHTVAYSDNKIGIVGGMALDPNTQAVINFGIYIAPDGNTAHIGYGKRNNEYIETENRKAVEGSCMYIKREVIESIGVFDEGFGMGYREEVDYCFRAREAGYRVVSTPTAQYIHFVSQTNSRLGITNDTHKYFMSKWGSKLALGKV